MSTFFVWHPIVKMLDSDTDHIFKVVIHSVEKVIHFRSLVFIREEV
jgi:hypothetical protein